MNNVEGVQDFHEVKVRRMGSYLLVGSSYRSGWASQCFFCASNCQKSTTSHYVIFTNCHWSSCARGSWTWYPIKNAWRRKSIDEASGWNWAIYLVRPNASYSSSENNSCLLSLSSLKTSGSHSCRIGWKSSHFWGKKDCNHSRGVESIADIQEVDVHLELSQH